MSNKVLTELGAWFITYEHRQATYAAVASYRDHYPNSHLWMTSDGGQDMSDIAEEFGGFWVPDKKHIGAGSLSKGWPGFDKEQMYIFARRLLAACDYCTEDWLLTMNPDLAVFGKVTEPDYLVAGSWSIARGVFSSGTNGEPWKTIKLRYPGMVDNGWGIGYGGCLTHRETLRSVVNKCLEEDWYEELVVKSANKWMKADDLFFTACFMMAGHQYGGMQQHDGMQQPGESSLQIEPVLVHRYSPFVSLYDKKESHG